MLIFINASHLHFILHFVIYINTQPFHYSLYNNYYFTVYDLIMKVCKFSRTTWHIYDFPANKHKQFRLPGGQSILLNGAHNLNKTSKSNNTLNSYRIQCNFSKKFSCNLVYSQFSSFVRQNILLRAPNFSIYKKRMKILIIMGQ